MARSQPSASPTPPPGRHQPTLYESPASLVRPGLSGVELLESHATVMDLVFSNSIGVSMPSWLCRRRRLCQISR